MFNYSDISIEQIDLIGPLWERLRNHHRGISTYFASHFENRTFAGRRVDFVKSHQRGKMKIELVRLAETGETIAYCVSAVANDGTGEVDSLFVEDKYRGHGIGTELVNRSLAWLKSNNAASIFIEVAYGNNDALPFYEKFGFFPRRIQLVPKLEAK